MQVSRLYKLHSTAIHTWICLYTLASKAQLAIDMIKCSVMTDQSG